MAVSPERRRELLAAVGLAEPEAPANATPTQSAIASHTTAPTQPLRVNVGAVKVAPTQPKPAARVPQSVTLALRDEAARTTPPGIRPAFAYQPMPQARRWPGVAPLREGEVDIARAQWLWEIAQADRTAARRQHLALDPVGLGHWGPIDDD